MSPMEKGFSDRAKQRMRDEERRCISDKGCCLVAETLPYSSPINAIYCILFFPSSK